MPTEDRPIAALNNTALVMGGYLQSFAGSAVAVLVAALTERWVGLSDLSLIFMLAVLMVAARTRTGPAVLTAVLCFLAYNFFFIEPRYTLYIGAPQGIATVGLFLAAALLAGRLASTLAMQVHALRIANHYAEARQELAHRLAVSADEHAILQAAHAIFREILSADVWMRLGNHGLHAPGVEPPGFLALRRVDRLSDGYQLAETVLEHGWWFLPLRAPHGTLGLIGLKLPAYIDRLDEGQRKLARAMADDVSQALLRVRLAADLETERLANETERLRSALLSSVSHDLRTPLASIIGSAGTLENYGEAMNDADRRSLLETIRVEGERLDRYIQNLLDMTRLGQGNLTLRRDWIGVDELIGSAIVRLQRYQPGARFTMTLDDDVGPIWVHPALVEQALFNVFENAAKFSPSGETVVIQAHMIASDRLQIDIRDQGPGIPEHERQRIFDMFYSVSRGDRGHTGTGLGLAICRGMIGAHGGEVEALPGHDGAGTTVRITLPLLSPTEATTP